MSDDKSDIIALIVMEQNLILYMDLKGFKVCAFRRTIDKVKAFLENEVKSTKIVGATLLQYMVRRLKVARKVRLS